MFRRIRQWFLRQMNRVHTVISTALRRISELPFHLGLDLRNALFPSRFMSKIPSTFTSPCMLLHVQLSVSFFYFLPFSLISNQCNNYTPNDSTVSVPKLMVMQVDKQFAAVCHPRLITVFTTATQGYYPQAKQSTPHSTYIYLSRHEYYYRPS